MVQILPTIVIIAATSLLPVRLMEPLKSRASLLLRRTRMVSGLTGQIVVVRIP